MDRERMSESELEQIMPWEYRQLTPSRSNRERRGRHEAWNNVALWPLMDNSPWYYFPPRNF
jgi:hypothetical protein